MSATDDGRFRPGSTVRRFRLGERTLVFSERAQALMELNATADAVWSALLTQETAGMAKQALAKAGLDPSAADEFVDWQLGEWLSLGHWEPSEGADKTSGRVLPLSIGGMAVDIACPEGWAADRIGQVFGQFSRAADDRPLAPVSVTVDAWAGGFHIFQDGDYVGAAGADALAPRLKALLTERLIEAPSDGFYAHGALLARGGRHVFLAGAPGAGKTTLAMALVGSGYGYLADDIVHVGGSGLFEGVAFAPAVKAGSWPLLQPWFPDIESWPTETRTDGCAVRYPSLSAQAAPATAPDLFVMLAREAGGAARSEWLDPVEALSALLSEGYSARRRLSGGQMAALAERFQTMDCRRLWYSALDAAVQEIERLIRGPGQ